MLISLSLFSPSLSGLPLLGGCIGLEVSPLYARRRAAGIRIHLLSAALLVRSPEGRRVHRMCVIPQGATLVVLLHRRGRIAESSPTTFRRGCNLVIGLKDRVAIGVIVELRGIGDCRYDYTNHVHAGTFPA